jgi:von Willebrand factor type A domain
MRTKTLTRAALVPVVSFAALVALIALPMAACVERARSAGTTASPPSGERDPEVARPESPVASVAPPLDDVPRPPGSLPMVPRPRPASASAVKTTAPAATGIALDEPVPTALRALSGGADTPSSPHSTAAEALLAGLHRGEDDRFPAQSIAAGEWNDNANYHEFQKWLATEASVPFRPVDVRQRRFLVVRDEEGRAVPGCEVAVSDAGQHAVTLTTGPSGRALLFPRAEGLADGLITATAGCEGASVTRPVPITDNDGFVDLRLPVLRHLAPERTIDVAFILDTTGSMSEEIASVKTTIAKVATGLGEGNVKVRIGLVEYKDRGDIFVTRVHPFATDVKGFAASVAGISAAGGGDTPESVNEGIHVALTGLDWQVGSVGKFAFLVGDAPPHLDYNQDFSYATDMKTAAHRGIQIFTVAASGMDLLGQVVWRQIAQYTNGANMFVLRGGAGRQSVGGGDPRSSCGGTQQNYASGNLDALILAKIDGELGAIEADPLRIAGLNEDENTKPCDQRVVINTTNAKTH